MSVEKDTLLFEVVVDLKKTEENTKKAVEALTRLRAEKEKTQKLFDNKQLGEDVYRKVMQSLTVEIDKTEKELSGYTKTLADHMQKEKAAEGVIKQMNASIAAMGFELGSLNDVQEKSGASAQQLAARIKGLNAELREQDAVADAAKGSMDALDDIIGETWQAYTQLTKAERENEEVGGRLLKKYNDLTRAQSANQDVVEKSKKGIKDYIRDIDVLGINVGSTIDSFKSGAQGAGMFAKAIFTGRGALIALTAVPIIALLSGLYIILTKSQKGMDFLAKATSGVSAIFSALTSKVIAIGEAFVGAFDNPKKALVELGNFVEQNLINRFKAFGVILNAIRSGDFSKIADGFLQLGTGISGAATGLKKVYDQGVAMEALNIRIQEGEIKLNAERAKSEKLIERQKQIAEDTTKSIEVRKKAEQVAFAESVRIQGKEEALQKQRIKLAQAEAKANQGNREARAKVAEEQAKLDEIAKNRVGERTELQNQLNAIEAEGAQKAEEAAKKRAEAAVAEAETALILAKRKGESTLEIEEEVSRRQIDLIRKRAAAEKVGAEVSIAQRKLIDEKARDEELEVLKAQARRIEERTVAIQEARIAAQLALVQKGTQAEFDLQSNALAARLDKEKAAAVDSIKNKEQLTAELRRLDAQYNADQEQLSLQFEQAQVTQEANMESQKLQIQQDSNEVRLSDLRGLAADRQTLEEKTQLALLEIEKKYALQRIPATDTKENNEARLKVEEQFQVRRNAIEAKGEADRREINRAIDGDVIADDKARSESRLALAREGSKEELLARVDGINAERDAALNVAHLTADQKKAINDKANRDIEDAEDEFRKRQIGKILDSFSQATSAVSSAINASIDAQTRAIDGQEKAALDSAALSAEAREKIEANYQKKKEKLEKEAAEKRKKIALIETAINTAKSIVEASPDPFLMALAGVIGALQIGVISSQQFAKGGIVNDGPVDGPSHKQGGIPMYHKSGKYVGEMEGKEIILTKGVYENPSLRAQASAINVAGGGRAFAGFSMKAPTPYPFRRFDYGGVLGMGNYASSAPQSAIDFDGLNRVVSQAVVAGVAQAVQSMPAPVVGVADITNGIDKRVRVINKADS